MDDDTLDVWIRQALGAIEAESPAPDAWHQLAARLARERALPGRGGRPPPAHGLFRAGQRVAAATRRYLRRPPSATGEGSPAEETTAQRYAKEAG